MSIRSSDTGVEIVAVYGLPVAESVAMSPRLMGANGSVDQFVASDQSPLVGVSQWELSWAAVTLASNPVTIPIDNRQGFMRMLQGLSYSHGIVA